MFNETPEQRDKRIQGVRRACKIVKECMETVELLITPGATTQQINDFVHNFLIHYKAYPAPLDYFGFPKSVCTAVNNVACHGIPREDEVLKNGDIISVDISAEYKGYYGDMCKTFFVGGLASNYAIDLVKHANLAMKAGIKAVKPGIKASNIGKAVQRYIKRQKGRYAVLENVGGHGIGTALHLKPLFLYGPEYKGDDIILEEGMTITVEPTLYVATGFDNNIPELGEDGWTIYLKDGALAAQFEHTVLITKDGVEILT